jgi:hypothetical protein
LHFVLGHYSDYGNRHDQSRSGILGTGDCCLCRARWIQQLALHNDHVNPSKGMHVLIFFTPVIVFLLVNAIRN